MAIATGLRENRSGVKLSSDNTGGTEPSGSARNGNEPSEEEYSPPITSFDSRLEKHITDDIYEDKTPGGKDVIVVRLLTCTQSRFYREGTREEFHTDLMEVSRMVKDGKYRGVDIIYDLNQSSFIPSGYLNDLCDMKKELQRYNGSIRIANADIYIKQNLQLTDTDITLNYRDTLAESMESVDEETR